MHSHLLLSCLGAHKTKLATRSLEALARWALTFSHSNPDQALEAFTQRFGLPIESHEQWRTLKFFDLNLAWWEAHAKNTALQAIGIWEENFPKHLKTIPTPPPVLFTLGDYQLLEKPGLAVVGSRRPTSYGCDVVHQFVSQIQRPDLSIVSGLALGIDAIAHRTALDCGLKTVAVLANGLSQIFPSAHLSLAHEIIAAGGALVSELPFLAAPTKEQFPRRNRIISGLSRWVWVVQGTAKSGSLHTAQHAMEQNRDVMVVPGSVFDTMNSLPNRLLQEGALVFTSAQELEIILGNSN